MVVKTFQSEMTSVPRAWLKIFKRSPASLSVLWMNPRQGPVCCLWLRRAAQRARHVDRQRESGAGRKGWGCTGGRSTPPFFISCCGMWNIKTWRRDQRSKVELDLTMRRLTCESESVVAALKHKKNQQWSRRLRNIVTGCDVQAAACLNTLHSTSHVFEQHLHLLRNENSEKNDGREAGNYVAVGWKTRWNRRQKGGKIKKRMQGKLGEGRRKVG